MDDELKKRRKLSYLMNEWDDVDLPYTVDDKSISHKVVEFFRNGSELIYPAKSYFVAIVYSLCLEKYFNVPFYTSLDDSELLPDDKYFVQYSKSKGIYDEILAQLDKNAILSFISVKKTVEYFKKEFLVDGTDSKDNGTV